MEQGGVGLNETQKLLDENRRFFEPLQSDLVANIEKLAGKNLLNKAKELGFDIYEFTKEYDQHMPDISFVAFFGDKAVLVKLSQPTDEEKKVGWKSTLQFDFLFARDLIKRLVEAGDKGIFKSGRRFQVEEDDYLAMNETVGFGAKDFVIAAIKLLKEIDDDVLVRSRASDDKRYTRYASLLKK